MVSVDDINNIFSKITENYEDPVPIGGRCESNVYYRTEDLDEDDLNTCAEYVAQRIHNLSPQDPELFFEVTRWLLVFC